MQIKKYSKSYNYTSSIKIITRIIVNTDISVTKIIIIGTNAAVMIFTFVLKTLQLNRHFYQYKKYKINVTKQRNLEVQ